MRVHFAIFPEAESALYAVNVGEHEEIIKSLGLPVMSENFAHLLLRLKGYVRILTEYN